MLLNDKVQFRMHWPQHAELQVNGISNTCVCDSFFYLIAREILELFDILLIFYFFPCIFKTLYPTVPIVLVRFISTSLFFCCCTFFMGLFRSKCLCS